MVLAAPIAQPADPNTYKAVNPRFGIDYTSESACPMLTRSQPAAQAHATDLKFRF